MLKFQLMTEKDRREAAYLERRKIQEEERKKRFFNPRARLIGVILWSKQTVGSFNTVFFR